MRVVFGSLLTVFVILAPTPALLPSGSPSPATHAVGNTLTCTGTTRPSAPCPTPTPRTSIITIETPSSNSPPQERDDIEVAGTATGLPSPQVIVRARDKYMRIIEEQIAPVEGPAGGPGAWHVTLHPPMFGFDHDLKIEAVARSPAGGAVVAEAYAYLDFYRGPIFGLVPDPAILQAELNRRNREELAARCQEHVTWPAYTVQPDEPLEALAARTGARLDQLRRANCLHDTQQPAAGQVLRVPRLPGPPPAAAVPNLLIDAPLTNAVLTPNAYFMVSGTATSALTGTILVRVLDTKGRALTEHAAQALTAANDSRQWSAELLVPDVPSGTRALIFAYVLSPEKHTILAADGVPVIFGTNEPYDYFAIDAPLPYTQVDTNTIVAVRGRGKYNGKLFAQTLDRAGRVLATLPVHDDGIDAYGERRWSADLPVESFQRGIIRVLLHPWDSGPDSTAAAVDVFFGDPASAPAGVRIDYPLPETLFTNQNRELHLHGTANEEVRVLIQNEADEVLRLEPVAADPHTSAWSYTTLIAPIDADGELTLQVLGASAAPDAAPITDRVTVRTEVDDAMVTGVVSFAFVSDLPDSAVVHVFIDKVKPGEEPTNHTLLADQAIQVDWSQPEVAFAVSYDSQKIDPAARYALSARIETMGATGAGLSTQAVPVITQGAPTRDVSIVVKQIMGYTGALALNSPVDSMR